jgi:hypothetical protein
VLGLQARKGRAFSLKESGLIVELHLMPISKQERNFVEESP